MNDAQSSLTVQERMTGFRALLEQLQQRYSMQLNIQDPTQTVRRRDPCQVMSIPNWQLMTPQSTSTTKLL